MAIDKSRLGLYALELNKNKPVGISAISMKAKRPPKRWP